MRAGSLLCSAGVPLGCERRFISSRVQLWSICKLDQKSVLNTISKPYSSTLHLSLFHIFFVVTVVLNLNFIIYSVNSISHQILMTKTVFFFKLN